MDKSLENYCKACGICIKDKSGTARPIGKLSKLGPANEPFEVMSIDTVGGFGGLGSSKKYMHILVDHFTRKAYISTSKHQTSNELMKLVNQVARENHIGTILADQYSSLKSEKFKNFLKKLSTKLIFTSVNNSESNGLNERLNRTLVNRIRCKRNSGDRRSWAEAMCRCEAMRR